MNTERPQCAVCPFDYFERLCRKEEGKSPKHCPTLCSPELTQESVSQMKSGGDFEFARNASIQEAEGYDRSRPVNGSVTPAKPRILETVEFAQKMGYSRMALIFCGGLRKEASVVHKMFEHRGFEMISIICKVGRVPKEVLGLTEEQKVHPGDFESMCNPILQANLANHYGSQFNILLGLCVGHDSLFLKHAEAPCTVLAVKDRLLGHNPLAAVYQFESYYNYLKGES